MNSKPSFSSIVSNKSYTKSIGSEIDNSNLSSLSNRSISPSSDSDILIGFSQSNKGKIKKDLPNDSLDNIHEFDCQPLDKDLIDNINKTNLEIQNIFKVNDLTSLTSKSNSNNVNSKLVIFLEENGFLILLRKIQSSELSFRILVNLTDEEILSFIEKENTLKFGKLRDFLLLLDDDYLGDDLLRRIHKTISDN